METDLNQEDVKTTLPTKNDHQERRKVSDGRYIIWKKEVRFYPRLNMKFQRKDHLLAIKWKLNLSSPSSYTQKYHC